MLNYFGASNTLLLFIAIILFLAIITFVFQSNAYKKEEKKFQNTAYILREAYYKNHFTRKKYGFFSAFATIIFLITSVIGALTPYPIMHFFPFHTIFLFNAWRLLLPLILSYLVLSLVFNIFMWKSFRHFMKMQEILNEKE